MTATVITYWTSLFFYYITTVFYRQSPKSKMNSKEIFCINLRHFRKLNDFTQEELSERLDITPAHLRRIENGKSFVTAELLDSLCLIFNISPATFFYTTQEFSGDDSLFSKIDTIIDEELKHMGIKLKERIRK